MRLTCLLVIMGLMLPGALLANDPDRAELERWLESDDDLPPSITVSHVNEGDLVFLIHPPQKMVHHHFNRLIIDKGSLEKGWVALVQCHENLDRVPRSQITYSKERVKYLEITSQRNIGESWIENSTVQLRDISADARLCVTARVKSLVSNHDGSYSLYNGPFMRRFLDGYYPMRVSMEIDYSDTALQLVDVSPVEQQGFTVNNDSGHLSFDTWFEGQLRTEFLFWLE